MAELDIAQGLVRYTVPAHVAPRYAPAGHACPAPGDTLVSNVNITISGAMSRPIVSVKSPSHPMCVWCAHVHA